MLSSLSGQVEPPFPRLPRLYSLLSPRGGSGLTTQQKLCPEILFSHLQTPGCFVTRNEGYKSQEADFLFLPFFQSLHRGLVPLLGM